MLAARYTIKYALFATLTLAAVVMGNRLISSEDRVQLASTDGRPATIPTPSAPDAAMLEEESDEPPDADDEEQDQTLSANEQALAELQEAVELDDSDSDDYYRAEVPDDLSPATMVSVGHNQACIVTTTSKVECWGGGDAARSDGIDNDATREVPNLTDVRRVEVGDASACAETKSGEVYCWGDAHEFEAAPPEGSTSIVDIQLP